ncbi:hypothetical protein ACQY0O_000509 [Thecaphora frezii]
MPHLDSLLSFPLPRSPSASSSRTPIPPVSSHIVVTDTLDSPAAFVLVHFLRAALGSNRLRSTSTSQDKGKARAVDRHVVWLSCDAIGLGHWRNVVRRSGIHLDAEIAAGRFRYTDASAHAVQQELGDTRTQPSASSSAPPKSLKRLYDLIAEQLQHIRQLQSQQAGEDPSSDSSWEADILIVVDDLSALAWSLEPVDHLGRPVDVALQVSRWIRALHTLATKSHACLVTLQHADATSLSKSSSTSSATDAVDESLFRSLCRMADVWIEVKELGSGRARDCDGEIAVHPLVRPSLASSQDGDEGATQSDGAEPPLAAFALDTPCPSRSKAMLYRIAPDGQTATSGAGAGGIGNSTGRVQVWARGTGRGFL